MNGTGAPVIERQKGVARWSARNRDRPVCDDVNVFASVPLLSQRANQSALAARPPQEIIDVEGQAYGHEQCQG
jgi:hypothetical protein